jgi:hypothetical protein
MVGVSHAEEASTRELPIEVPAVAATAATPSSEEVIAMTPNVIVEQVIINRAPALPTAISPQVNVVPSHPFALNTLVFARFKGGNTAYRGAVAGVRLVKAKGRAKTEAAAVFYSIAYDDGDEEDDVPARLVRFRGNSIEDKPKAAAVLAPQEAAADAASAAASAAPACAEVSNVTVIAGAISGPAAVIRIAAAAGLPAAAPASAAASIEAAAIVSSTRLPVEIEEPQSVIPPTGSLQTQCEAQVLTVAAADSVVMSTAVATTGTGGASLVATSTETEPCRDAPSPTLSKAESKDDDDSPGLVIIAKKPATLPRLNEEVAMAMDVATTKVVVSTTTVSSSSVSAALTSLTSEPASASASLSISQSSVTVNAPVASVDSCATPAPPASSSVAGEVAASVAKFDLGDGESKTSSRPTTPTRSTAAAVKFSKTLVSPGGGGKPSHRSNSPRSTSLKK